MKTSLAILVHFSQRGKGEEKKSSNGSVFRAKHWSWPLTYRSNFRFFPPPPKVGFGARVRGRCDGERDLSQNQINHRQQLLQCHRPVLRPSQGHLENRHLCEIAAVQQCFERKEERDRDRDREIQRDRETEREIERETERETERDRQIDRLKYRPN